VASSMHVGHCATHASHCVSRQLVRGAVATDSGIGGPARTCDQGRCLLAKHGLSRYAMAHVGQPQCRAATRMHGGEFERGGAFSRSVDGMWPHCYALSQIIQ
jgi:hypothetical protein